MVSELGKAYGAAAEFTERLLESRKAVRGAGRGAPPIVSFTSNMASAWSAYEHSDDPGEFAMEIGKGVVSGYAGSVVSRAVARAIFAAYGVTGPAAVVGSLVGLGASLGIDYVDDIVKSIMGKAAGRLSEAYRSIDRDIRKLYLRNGWYR